MTLSSLGPARSRFAERYRQRPEVGYYQRAPLGQLLVSAEGREKKHHQQLLEFIIRQEGANRLSTNGMGGLCDASGLYLNVLRTQLRRRGRTSQGRRRMAIGRRGC